jgi:hypothetical protein
MRVVAQVKENSKYANKVYAWERANLHERHEMTPMQSARFVKHILSIEGFNYIEFNITNDDEECSFVVNANGEKGDAIPLFSDTYVIADKKNTRLKGNNGGLLNHYFSFRMSKYFGLNEILLCHEVAHYITFFYIMLYVAKNKITKASALEQKIFSGHGKIWCSVYFYLLDKYAKQDREKLYEKIQGTELAAYHLDGLSFDQITEWLE